MILDAKAIMQPPPPYVSSPGPSPFSHRAPCPTFASLPAHVLLQVVYSTVPHTGLIDQATPERQRKTLYWLAVSLRLVDRALYVACMHVLRSTYLPAYDSLIRAPYSTDPFPLLFPVPPSPSTPSTAPSPYAPQSTAAPAQSPLQTIQRETATLDLFIALKVREDVWADDSELHLERDESFKDLFDLNQPRSRLEDLVRTYGLRDGVITIYPSQNTSNTTASARSPSQPIAPSPYVSVSTTSSFFSSSFSKAKSMLKPSPSPGPPSPRVLTTQPCPRFTPIPFNLLSVSFSSRKVGLVLLPTATSSSSGKRTIVETTRTRDERLEPAAKRLVKELRAWLVDGG